MIDAQFLHILRCPIDPKREASLVLEEDVRLLCANCRVQFPIKDGFPNFVVAEAILPEGCAKIEKLPCRLKDAGK
jgi:uncharacterized protein YbaR (Trm112 family)